MSRRLSFAVILLGTALAALPAFSQEAGRSEVAVQAFGSFVTTTTDNGIQQGATNSGGVLASYRFFFFEQPRRGGELRLLAQHGDLWITDRRLGSEGESA